MKKKTMFLNLETFIIFTKLKEGQILMRYFETKFLEDADKFLGECDSKTVKKILYNIDLAEKTIDTKLLKKLHSNIWEFRTNFKGLQIRLLAFWDKSETMKTHIIATHGFIKKTNKIPENEIKRALRLREKYFEKTK